MISYFKQLFTAPETTTEPTIVATPVRNEFTPPEKTMSSQYLKDIADVEANTTATCRVVINYFGAITIETLIPEIDSYKLQEVLPNEFYEASGWDLEYFLYIKRFFSQLTNAKITFWKII